MTPTEKLHSIRIQIRKHKLDAYLIPITDPHMSEYVPLHWRTIEWFSGFSGSAATVVITADFAGLWTDSRYFLQAEDQLKNSGLSLVKLKIPHSPEYIEWLTQHLNEGDAVGCHGELLSIGLVKKVRQSLSAKNIQLKTDIDLISPLWKHRPPLPAQPIYEHPAAYTGLSRMDKITIIRNEMNAKGVMYHLLTALDDIAWTFNIRGFDSTYSPLVVSFALIGKNTCYLFIDHKKIPEHLNENLEQDGVHIQPYLAIYDHLEKLSKSESVYLSPASVNARLFESIPEDCEIREGLTIPTRLKARKNSTELSNIRETMIREGVVLVQFIHWLETNVGGPTQITEMGLETKLHELRSFQEGYMGPSFATIAGYKGHGAIVHYEATPETDSVIKPEGILLVDTGGQYLGGTTDMTRTIALSLPSDKEKRDFTLVLKGMIQLALLKFPEGTKGYQLEAFARKALWDQGYNYGHGTGHGIGYFLNVHEGPQTIGSGASGDRDVPLEPGMVISDEPGLYREGQYGIRTENVLVVLEDRKTEYGTFLKFETLTLCPIDRSLIMTEMLTNKEREWINEYHRSVYKNLSSHLSAVQRKWLKAQTTAI